MFYYVLLLDFQFGIFTYIGLEVFSLFSVLGAMIARELLQTWNVYDLVGGMPKHCVADDSLKRGG